MPDLPEGQVKAITDAIILDAKEDPTRNDAAIWEATLRAYRASSDPTQQSVGKLLEWIFVLLRFGGLLYCDENDHETWKPWNMPLASALSHGGRVIIQYRTGDRFWANFETYNVLGRRPGSSHYLDALSTAEVLNVGSRQLRKWWHEGKVDTKGLGVLKQLNAAGRDLGVDLAVGGSGTEKFAGGSQPSEAMRRALLPLDAVPDGSFGHLFVYHHGHDSTNGTGCVMIGVEGSSPFIFSKRTSVLGKAHTAKAEKGRFSGTYGVKFSDETFSGRGPRPTEYNGMFVELVGDYTQQLRRVGGEGWWNLDLAWLKEAPLQPAEIRRPYLWDFEL